ncbi:MFS transporter [Patescibacteria group bacterium]|nr:MFS transporter [Patescibacteria group bacterium]
MKLLKTNKAVQIIIAFDFFIIGAFALLAPVYAIFITENIVGGTVAVVGFALAIYWIVKSVLQLPVGVFIDRMKGEKDDLYVMALGTFLGAGVMLTYVFAGQIWHVYALQALFGLADALFIPPFFAIFTRHIDKGSEGFQWSLRSSISYGGGSALGGAIGGLMAAKFGFESVFITISALTLLSMLLLLLLRKEILPRKAAVRKPMPLENKR